jgi:hypothetical protein
MYSKIAIAKSAQQSLSLAAAVVGYVDLVSTPDAAEVAAPVARGVDENGAAAGTVTGPQAGAGSVVDRMRQPGCGEGFHPGSQSGADGCVVKVERQARAVADQSGSAVRGHEQFVSAACFRVQGAGFEDSAQALCPGTQYQYLASGCRRLMDIVVVQDLRESGRLGRRVVDQPGGDVCAGVGVSVDDPAAFAAAISSLPG